MNRTGLAPRDHTHVLGVRIQEFLLERSHERVILVLLVVKSIPKEIMAEIPQEMRDSVGVKDVEMIPNIHL